MAIFIYKVLLPLVLGIFWMPLHESVDTKGRGPAERLPDTLVDFKTTLKSPESGFTFRVEIPKQNLANSSSASFLRTKAC